MLLTMVPFALHKKQSILKALRSPAAEVPLSLLNSMIFNVIWEILLPPPQTALTYYYPGTKVPKKLTLGNTENNKPFWS